MSTPRPRPTLTRRGALVGGIAALAVLATGCGTTEDRTGDPPAAGAEATAGPVTFTDSRGTEQTLDAPATTVVALEWGEAETLTSLGVTLAGIADKEGFTTWDTAVTLEASVEDVGTRGEPSVDAIVALEPDLVVMNGADGVTPLVKQIEKYAPVLLTRGADASGDMERLEEDVRTMAAATGKDAEAEQLLSQMQQALDDGKQKIADAGNGGTPFLMADGWKEGSTVSVRMFAKGSEVSDIGEALGLVNAWKEPGDEAWGLGQTDVEGLSGYTAEDLHFFYSASEDDVFADGLAGNRIWERLPFVQKGNMTHFEPGTWTFGGPASVMHIAEQMVAALTA